MKELEYYITVFSSFLKDRNSRKDKDHFLELAVNIFTNLGYDANVEIYNDRLKTKNLIVGNPKAQNTIMAAYDVPNRLLINYPYLVNNSEKTKKLETTNVFIILFVIAIVIALSTLLFYLVSFLGPYRYVFVFVIIIILYVLYRYLFSCPKNNFAFDGPLSVLYAFADQERDKKEDYCFVLCDNASLNYWGIRLYLKKHGGKNIIILEKTSAGTVVEFRSDGHSNNDMIGRKVTFIAKGQKDKGEISIENTRNGKAPLISIDDLLTSIEKIKKVSKNK